MKAAGSFRIFFAFMICFSIWRLWSEGLIRRAPTSDEKSAAERKFGMGRELKLFFPSPPRSAKWKWSYFLDNMTFWWFGHDYFVYRHLHRFAVNKTSDIDGLVVPFSMNHDGGMGIDFNRVFEVVTSLDGALSQKWVVDKSKWIWLFSHDYGRCLGWSPGIDRRLSIRF
jgi:hypothetical protein